MIHFSYSLLWWHVCDLPSHSLGPQTDCSIRVLGKLASNLQRQVFAHFQIPKCQLFTSFSLLKCILRLLTVLSSNFCLFDMVLSVVSLIFSFYSTLFIYRSKHLYSFSLITNDVISSSYIGV